MVILGLLMIVGGFFGAFLFNLNVGWGDKRAAIIRNMFIVIAVIGIILFGGGIYQAVKMPLYEYRVNVHYIDGSTRILLFDSKRDPEIKACRGTYWIKYGAGTELGVVRFEIISKKEKKDD